MTIIRQISFFGIQELYEMAATHCYDAIFSAINSDKICHAISKKSNLGARSIKRCSHGDLCFHSGKDAETGNQAMVAVFDHF
ncbi:UNVERIFIED_ORG: hypothetical protein ABRZ91_001907 [Heyndrickxia coagulans]